MMTVAEAKREEALNKLHGMVETINIGHRKIQIIRDQAAYARALREYHVAVHGIIINS